MPKVSPRPAPFLKTIAVRLRHRRDRHGADPMAAAAVKGDIVTVQARALDVFALQIWRWLAAARRGGPAGAPGASLSARCAEFRWTPSSRLHDFLCGRCGCRWPFRPQTGSSSGMRPPRPGRGWCCAATSTAPGSIGTRESRVGLNGQIRRRLGRTHDRVLRSGGDRARSEQIRE